MPLFSVGSDRYFRCAHKLCISILMNSREWIGFLLEYVLSLAAHHNHAAREAHSEPGVGAAVPSVQQCWQAGRRSQASIKPTVPGPPLGQADRPASGSPITMVRPRHSYGTRSATGILPGLPTPAAALILFSPAVFVVPARTARKGGLGAGED